MQRLDPERVDLASLTSHLRESFPSEPLGSIVGRTQLRDEVARQLGCSLLEAEQLVDTLVARGFVTAQRDRDGSVHWALARRAGEPT